MTPAAGPLPWLRDRAGRSAVLGVGAAAVLGAWAFLVAAADPAAGWLVGLCFWISVALGASAMLAVHGLTGGGWGEALRPALAPAAVSLPVFLPLAVPLLLALSVLYPWAADPDAGMRPDVARFYLNPTGFVLRTVAALVGWSATAWLLARLRPGGSRTLAAGLGLAFHLAAVTLVSVDWLLSLDPHFRSTAFGMAALATQVLAALAWAALLRPEPPGEAHGAAADLAALMLAAVLGVLYLGFVQYLIAWYGDLPEKAAWFLRRQGWGWAALQAASLLCSGLLPLAALLLAQVRRSPRALAPVGALVLAGIAAHLCWIVAPVFGAASLLAAALGVLAVGGLWVGVAYGPWLARAATPAGTAAR